MPPAPEPFRRSPHVAAVITDTGWSIVGPTDAIHIIWSMLSVVAPVLAPTFSLKEPTADVLEGDRDVSRNMRFVCMVAHTVGYKVWLRDARTDADGSVDRLFLPNRNVLEQWTRTRDALNMLLSNRDTRSLMSAAL